MEKITELLNHFLQQYNNYVGGYALLFLLIPAGFFYAFRFKFISLTRLGYSLRILSGKYDKESDKGEINHFRALTTALSATVGTGNIVGVALAIYFGGPGAVFWMWITGLLGMMLKLVECTLSVKYRKINKDGSVSGGPMYYMENGLKKQLGKFAKILAIIFAFATILSAFGQGNMAQSHSISDVINTNYHIPKWIPGLILTSLVSLVIVGGIKRIARVASMLVPFMAGIYILSALSVLVIFSDKVPSAFALIFRDAFTGTAMTGGFVGSAFITTILWGVRRGVFSNEAGQGSAAIAFAATKTEKPIREGLVSSIGPLVDTLIVCSLTALVIIVTNTWQSGIKGVAMTVEGFNRGLSVINLGQASEHVVAIGLILFAFSTMIGWSYYGSKATEYIFGRKHIKTYQVIYIMFVFLGSIWGIDLVWQFVDAAVTLMTIPNIIALLLLTPIIAKEIKKL